MSSDLSTDVLRAVSRSFYLTIRVLPRAMREPVAVAYLLARASDTIADSADAPAERRVEWLRNFGDALAEESPDPAALERIAEGTVTPHVGEQELMRRLPECVARYRKLRSADRGSVRAVLEKILRGQTLDVTRFAGAEMVALPDAAALEEYTYLVAGCVGEFWTEVALRHCLGYARKPGETLRELGIDFGKGLQLINVLRDLPADLKEGRCYLPGLRPEDPVRARPLVELWQDRAEVLLRRGGDYVEQVRPWRLRLAVFLPWYLGVRTLQRMRVHRPLESSRKVKVSRAEVRKALWLGVRCAVWGGAMKRVRRDLGL